ncbi:MAG: hypothetical protein QFE16_14105 [Pseudomonadota bacterium]|nr:hypothetical protein [Pseudomonadota bacterium]
MTIDSVSAKAVFQPSKAQQRTPKFDADAGADKAQELGSNSSASSVVKISQEAQQILAGTIANDADQGRDGK